MTKETCRTVVKVLGDNSSRLIGRFVSVPRMTERELQGSQNFWTTILKEMEDECQCKFPKTKKAIKEAYAFYRKQKVGKAALRMARAGTSLSDEAKKCSLK